MITVRVDGGIRSGYRRGPWTSSGLISVVFFPAMYIKTQSFFKMPLCENYTKKVICCGTQNNVLLLVFCTIIIHIQDQNKVVECLVAWLTMHNSYFYSS
jgi:hypothetical protein